MRNLMKLMLASALVTAAACALIQPPLGLQAIPKPQHERPDAPGQRAAFDNARRLPPGASAINPAWYAAAEAQARRLPSFSTEAGRFVTGEKTSPRWQWLGPSNVGGRTRTLVFDPRDPQRMLAGGVSGASSKPPMVACSGTL